MACPNLLLHPAQNWIAHLSDVLDRHSYSFFPIKPGQKATTWRNHTLFGRMRPSQEQLARWPTRYPTYGVAFACGAFLTGIDIDEVDQAKADQLQDLAFRHLGVTPLVRIGQAPKRLLVYRTGSSPNPTRRVGAVEILGDGRYFVGFNIHPKTKEVYRWPSASPATLPWTDLPCTTAEALATFLNALPAFYSIPASTTVPSAALAGATPMPSVRTSRPTTDIRWILDADGRVADGRDAYLAGLTYRFFAAGLVDAESIAKAAWGTFTRTTNLARPKRDGAHPWTFADALKKARQLLASGKPRPPSCGRRGARSKGFWTLQTKQAFRRVVDAAGASGELAPSVVAVSHAMLAHIEGDGSAFVSVETLAKTLGHVADTVKKARRVLRNGGFWTSHGENIGGRSRLAHYRPNPAVLDRADPHVARLNAVAARIAPAATASDAVAALQTVAVPSTRSNQWVGGISLHDRNINAVSHASIVGLPDLGSTSSKSASPECRDNPPSGAAPDVAEMPSQ